jgi:hypothetical protein
LLENLEVRGVLQRLRAQVHAEVVATLRRQVRVGAVRRSHQ